MPPTDPRDQGRLNNRDLPACARCRFFAARDADDGECRIRPPRCVVVTASEEHDFPSRHEAMAIWPSVAPWQWCGAFKPVVQEVPNG